MSFEEISVVVVERAAPHSQISPVMIFHPQTRVHAPKIVTGHWCEFAHQISSLLADGLGIQPDYQPRQGSMMKTETKNIAKEEVGKSVNIDGLVKLLEHGNNGTVVVYAVKW